LYIYSVRIEAKGSTRTFMFTEEPRLLDIYRALYQSDLEALELQDLVQTVEDAGSLESPSHPITYASPTYVSSFVRGGRGVFLKVYLVREKVA